MKFEQSSKLIKLVRLRLGLTQLEFAELLGLDSAQFVSNLERGEAALPAKRGHKIKAVLSKEALLKAYVDDIKSIWRKEYEEV